MATFANFTSGPFAAELGATFCPNLRRCVRIAVLFHPCKFHVKRFIRTKMTGNFSARKKVTPDNIIGLTFFLGQALKAFPDLWRPSFDRRQVAHPRKPSSGHKNAGNPFVFYFLPNFGVLLAGNDVIGDNFTTVEDNFILLVAAVDLSAR
ncbi:hypothetical protein [Thiolapillus sp.]|uniref:hypothetical protein n=1 Tax=Thiolapillus sp. TaxID=2017437 RepID=UPI003AF64BE9